MEHGMKRFAVILIALMMITGIASAEKAHQQFEVIEQLEAVNIRGSLVITDLVYDVDTLVVYYRVFGANGLSMTPYIMINSFGSATVGIYDPKTEVIVPAESYFLYEEEDDGIQAVGRL